MVAQITPIVEADPGGYILRLKVDERVRRLEVTFLRLQFMLSAVCEVSDINVRDRARDGFDLELFGSVSDGRLLDWATKDALNDSLSKLSMDPVMIMRPSTLKEMCYLVVVDFRLQEFHQWRLKKALGPVAQNARIIDDPDYNGNAMMVFAPLVGTAGWPTVEELEARIRLYLKRDVYAL